VAQLVVTPVAYPRYVQADEVTGGERGQNGFGSTGR
jgi:dUTPase